MQPSFGEGRSEFSLPVAQPKNHPVRSLLYLAPETSFDFKAALVANPFVLQRQGVDVDPFFQGPNSYTAVPSFSFFGSGHLAWVTCSTHLAGGRVVLETNLM